jgi:hypothetical protein
MGWQEVPKRKRREAIEEKQGCKQPGDLKEERRDFQVQ